MRNKTAPFLVAIQIALSLAILSNAMHVVNIRLHDAHRPSGLADEANTFSMRISAHLPLSQAEKISYQKRIVQVASAVAGVVSAAEVSQMPMSQAGWNVSISTDRHQTQPSAIVSLYLSPDSLIKSLGLQLVAGRDFTDSDVIEQDPDGEKIKPDQVIVTQALAQNLFPDAESYTGKSFFWGTGSGAKESHIIGVVARLQTPSAPSASAADYSVLLPVRTASSSPMLVIRSEHGQVQRVIAEVETALRAASTFPVRIDSKTSLQDRQQRYGKEMSIISILVVVSVLLLIISASGIVGVSNLWLTQRRQQIGMRRALGARKVDILRYFITENVMISTAGIGGGMLLAIGLNQLLINQLDIAPLPLSYVALGAIGLLLLGVLAAAMPAWRAASISPAVASKNTFIRES
ncbi:MULTISPECIES: FtsX-like permease family protein [unclassified Undibacterium]|uniref:FtsX-like permease family protein n=1 Tax=unclassified Undibacterium TaxID=2630295 RepID=UPI002AC8A375|nr:MULTISPECIES: FtsX-like permease family protein [unclassified Undibacterium]MEB0138167.1 FtsX-like permease family protein [Undibacterium sp. CCC2.1]MEB0171078.1 FtsX-like permease family protein [Undibacterium sp. CCC1.1]MEB0175123.1 FtsX-like permease family protein [Undibacterium sp. CCC3.4]MEB0214293.1 FtsX-like permease family protein [Undibacterium sp. 5I2]WPX41873.1 FtsX-like permease family protein [Undibacterium sp. CCC3.4]